MICKRNGQGTPASWVLPFDLFRALCKSPNFGRKLLINNKTKQHTSVALTVCLMCVGEASGRVQYSSKKTSLVALLRRLFLW